MKEKEKELIELHTTGLVGILRVSMLDSGTSESLKCCLCSVCGKQIPVKSGLMTLRQ